MGIITCVFSDFIAKLFKSDLMSAAKENSTRLFFGH